MCHTCHIASTVFFTVLRCFLNMVLGFWIRIKIPSSPDAGFAGKFAGNRVAATARRQKAPECD
jgi:hypothetical protein